MKVLVTGANGQVGMELRRAAAKGVRVLAYGASEFDVTDAACASAIMDRDRPDCVINCAAYTNVDGAEADPDLAYAVNELGCRNVAHACEARSIPLVHVSTDYVFDGRSTTPYTETDTTAPLNVYGASKLAGEDAIQEVLETHAILRVSWIFGNIGRSFVDTMLRLGAERDELRVVDDQIGAPCSARAVASALLEISRCLTADPGTSGIYHGTSEPAVSWFGFAREIFAVAERLGILAKSPRVIPIPTSEFPAPAARPKYSVLSGERLRSVCGVHPSDWRAELMDSLKARTA
ncbi:MAG: dTDP-4-dehydrorhamnose reductase [Gammaproteobacteria bacterium]|nr:dTDP-4-dehydrorhamnose reductase [Gammaproteobacteria bacterium]